MSTEHFDDAGVYRISEGLAVVQTLDFFPPLVDDPYIFGQIAAANSLSDVYAMGGVPITALNIVGFPDTELPAQILSDILKGGAERVVEAGAVIVGGHSVRDAEIKYGLAVTGTIHPDRVVRNDTAQPGDVLVLTKPIGSGVLTSAAKLGKMPVSGLAEAIGVMIHLNRGACEAMQSVGVHAATDVTGFGLIGHAFEMANGSDVTIELDTAAIPLLTDTLKFAGDGCLTRSYKSNLAYIGEKLVSEGVDEGVDELLIHILGDAQTSGGLLIAVAEEKADALVTALKTAAAPCATPIGRVLEFDGTSIRCK